MNYQKPGLIVTFFAGLGLMSMINGTGSSDAEMLEKAKAHYQLDMNQSAFAESCLASHEETHTSFPSGTKRPAGCGCVAGELGKAHYLDTQRDTEMVSDVYLVALKARSASESREDFTAYLIPRISAMAARTGKTELEIAQLLNTIATDMLPACEKARI